MAEIHIEKKERGSLAWLWIALAILVLAIVAWMVWPRGDVAEPIAAVPGVVDTAMTATGATLEPLAGDATLAAINANPQQWVGREFTGTVTAASVPTDRGFWIEQNGQRLFAILVDSPAEQPIDINQGQTLRIRGTVRDATFLSQIPGVPITAATEQIIRQQPVYLVADESAIQIQS